MLNQNRRQKLNESTCLYSCLFSSRLFGIFWHKRYIFSRQPSKEKFNYRLFGGGGQGRVSIVKAGLAIGFLTTVQECHQLPLSFSNHLIRPKNSPDSVEGTHMCKSVDHHQDGTKEGCQIAYAISSAASTNRRTGDSSSSTHRQECNPAKTNRSGRNSNHIFFFSFCAAATIQQAVSIM
jgi:hypothetical protein